VRVLIVWGVAFKLEVPFEFPYTDHMKNKNTIVSNLKWNMSPEERSMHLFYTMESIRENLIFIERNLDTDLEPDIHRIARLEELEEQLCLMADHLDSRKNIAALTV
jgi:hypothetical protein